MANRGGSQTKEYWTDLDDPEIELKLSVREWQYRMREEEENLERRKRALQEETEKVLRLRDELIVVDEELKRKVKEMSVEENFRRKRMEMEEFRRQREDLRRMEKEDYERQMEMESRREMAREQYEQQREIEDRKEMNREDYRRQWEIEDRKRTEKEEHEREKEMESRKRMEREEYELQREIEDRRGIDREYERQREIGDHRGMDREEYGHEREVEDRRRMERGGQYGRLWEIGDRKRAEREEYGRQWENGDRRRTDRGEFEGRRKIVDGGEQEVEECGYKLDKLELSGSTRRTKREKLPPTYDGKSPWKDFFLQFEACRKYNDWNGEESALQLFTCCKEDALAALIANDLNPDELAYEELVNLLKKEYGPRECVESYFLELSRREQKPGEKLYELARSIKNLTTLSHPRTDKKERDRIARQHFQNAIGDAEIRKAVFHGHPLTLDDAVTLAESVESFNNAEKSRGRRVVAYSRRVEGDSRDQVQVPSLPSPEPRHTPPPPIQWQFPPRFRPTPPPPKLSQLPPQLPPLPVCYGCKEPGHLLRQCTRGYVCYRCGRDGHFARDCPGNESWPNQWSRGTPDRRQ